MDKIIEKKAKKSGLGRGLNALLSQTAVVKASSDTSMTLKKIPVNQLRPGKYQPRKHMNTESLQELADSIQQQGILQPISVRAIGYEQYEIIAGERRWRAAQLAKLVEVPVCIHVVSDQNALALALIENIQREDLNPIEEAYALHRLIEEFGFTHQKAAEAVGKSRTNVTNLLRLLNLSAPVKQCLEEGQLEMGHARALLMLSLEQQHAVAQIVIAKGLSVRETEQLVKKQRLPQGVKSEIASPKQKNDPNWEKFQTSLSERLGAKVMIHHTSRTGAGSLVIYYNSLSELDGIAEHIQ